MDLPEPVQKPATRWPTVIGWGIFAAAAGLCCVVLPPYLTPNGMVNPSYGQPLIPWFASAIANCRLLPTLISMFVLGVVLGVAQPRRWPLLSCLTVSLVLLLHGMNIIHDLFIYPKSHTLFPFEIAFLIFLASPALAGGGLVYLIRQVIQSRKPFQFSLRTLFVATTLIAVGFGGIFMIQRPVDNHGINTMLGLVIYHAFACAAGAGILAPFNKKMIGACIGGILCIPLTFLIRYLVQGHL